ncbi:MAG: MarR family transcriptional regulator [Prosthecochloris sp.]|nr:MULTISPECIES: HTH domain-containing protein [unclassified Prosthecochloris]MCW8798394.1 MarR family transcriptional regulator [Prosthecochloris sp.]
MKPNQCHKHIDAQQHILDVLKQAGAAMSAAQIAEASGLDRQEIDKAMKLLKAEEAIVSPKRCYWESKQ